VILALIDEAVASGARIEMACEIVGLPARTIQRWRRGCGDDLRSGPRTEPPNKLSPAERKRIIAVATSPEFRDSSPSHIVPQLADRGVYIASESTFHRTLRDENLAAHREASAPRRPRARPQHQATGPNQVWCWDITFLLAAVRGTFYRLYMLEDVWSRKIVGWAVHESECNELAAQLFAETCAAMKLDPAGLVLHSDNGGPMKGSTMLATLQRLGVVPSFSRPSVSDDNAFIESLFRTLKYRPGYPSGAFASIEAARAWVADFVAWYNTEHLHSGISFVTPEARHAGKDEAILARRRDVYARARDKHPERWSGRTRRWNHVKVVRLSPQNPPEDEKRDESKVA
jgi:transposase InsO family protein